MLVYAGGGVDADGGGASSPCAAPCLARSLRTFRMRTLTVFREGV
jgi:hypothetical protein